MIEEGTDFYEIEQKFLVVLDSAIPTSIGNNTEVYTDITQIAINNSFTNKSDLVFLLQYPIEKNREDIQLKASIKSAIFPNSQYLINDTNNLFAIQLLDNSTPITPILDGGLVIQISNGNYDTESLRVELQTKINSAFASSPYPDVVFSVSYNYTTLKYTFSFTTSNSGITQFYISFQPKDIATNTSVSQLGTIIGFLNDFIYFSGYKVSSLATNAVFSYKNKSIDSAYPSNLSGLRCFNVILKNYSTSSIPIIPYNSQLGYKNSIVNSSFNNSSYQQGIRNNVICNVVCNCNPFEYIYYEKSSDFYIDLQDPQLNRLHILLTDNYGNLLDLNNQDWSITFEFSILKRKEFKTKSFYEYLSQA